MTYLHSMSHLPSNPPDPPGSGAPEEAARARLEKTLQELDPTWIGGKLPVREPASLPPIGGMSLPEYVMHSNRRVRDLCPGERVFVDGQWCVLQPLDPAGTEP